MSSNYMSTLPAIERERYIHKLNLVNLKTCPFILPALNWCNNPTQWPDVSYPDISLYHLLVYIYLYYFSPYSGFQWGPTVEGPNCRFNTAS